MPWWTEEDEREAHNRARAREEVRRSVGFQPWWELLSSDGGEAAALVQERKLPTINIHSDTPSGAAQDFDSLIDLLAHILHQNGHILTPWTMAQVRRREVGGHWNATGWWHLVFSSAEDAVLARLLLADHILDR